MSVVDILKKHGKWTETKKLAKIVAKEHNISVRQAYRKISRAWKNKEIRKLTLPDRNVLCGLPEWPFSATTSKKPRGTLRFKDTFLLRCFKKLDEIGSSNLQDSVTAFLKLRSFIMTLPPSLKEKIKPDYARTEKSFLERKHLSFPINLDLMLLGRMEREEIGAPEVDYLIDKISTLLHEQLERKES